MQTFQWPFRYKSAIFWKTNKKHIKFSILEKLKEKVDFWEMALYSNVYVFLVIVNWNSADHPISHSIKVNATMITLWFKIIYCFWKCMNSMKSIQKVWNFYSFSMYESIQYHSPVNQSEFTIYHSLNFLEYQIKGIYFIGFFFFSSLLLLKSVFEGDKLYSLCFVVYTRLFWMK